jgi:glucose-1-phosphate cytidylyltransferase
MIEIGGRPILWHIMKLYSYYGFDEFVVCLGYKGYIIKEFFANYFLHQSDVTIDLRHHNTEIHDSKAEPWRITLVDTGSNTQTGGRIKRVQKYIGYEPFMLTYGDGVGNVNLQALSEFHRRHGKLATITAVQPSGRFGALWLDNKDNVLEFQEKPKGDRGWINGGFFILDPKVLDYIEGDGTYWERGPLESLAREGQIVAYKHDGFWQPMDTLRDKNHLEGLWQSGKAPWKVWED